MKLFLFISILFLSACAGGGGGGSSSVPTDPGSCAAGIDHVGTWTKYESPTNVIVLNANLTATNQYCGESLTYTAPSGPTGSIDITIVSNNGGAGCPSASTTTCNYTLCQHRLQLNCGAGVATYWR